MSDDEVIKRKGHSNVLTKIYARFVVRPVREFLPYVRYLVLPSMAFYSLLSKAFSKAFPPTLTPPLPD